jgi:lysosomal alpha-mannosidase
LSYLDRSEGGGSIYDGSIEIMVHRRTLYDDGLGVGEALNETAFAQGLVVRGKHFLILEPPANSALIHRVDAQQLFMQPIATYALPTTSYVNYSSTYRQTWSALSDSMPLNVYLLTFDQFDPKQFLIRVEHYFELNEDEIYSQPVKFDLQKLFKSLGTSTNFSELTLGANLPLSDLHRLDWMTTDKESSHVHMISESCFDQKSRLYFVVGQTSLKDTTITLNPMQIKIFQVTL